MKKVTLAAFAACFMMAVSAQTPATGTSPKSNPKMEVKQDATEMKHDVKAQENAKTKPASKAGHAKQVHKDVKATAPATTK